MRFVVRQCSDVESILKVYVTAVETDGRTSFGGVGDGAYYRFRSVLRLNA